jgi:hypothetical protein
MAVELHMLPVQAGDATLLIDRSEDRPYTVLIDAGLAKDEVVAYLQSIGIYHLDLIILSHPDLDHLQGLLSLVDNSLISLEQVWCFDLAFLREFIETGKLPRPKAGRHVIVYEVLLATLVGMDKMLKGLGKREGVVTLQVSSGHKINLGKLHIEVLYPWDGFYASLYSPARIKRLLSKKWPSDWLPPEWARADIERERTVSTKKIAASQERDTLDALLKEIESSNLDNTAQPLSTPNIEEEEYAPEDFMDSEDDSFPISLIGSLYNNLSIVIKVHVLGGIDPPTMLFPGDLTDWTYLLARRFLDLPADIFKYPHHGSSGPAISRQALKKYGFSFPPPCPCGPWFHPDWCEWNYRFWRRLEETMFHSRDASTLFSKVIRPRHTLVYPYPSQGLPKPNVLSRAMGKIHANRKKLNTHLLADPSNPATAHVLKIGEEKHEIEVVSSGVK